MWNRCFRSTYLQFDKRIHHDLGIVRVKEVLETTCSSTEGGQQEGTVGYALGPWCGHSNRVMSRDAGNDLASFGKGFSDDGIGNTGGLLLVCGANPGKDDDLLDRTTVLLVNLHDIEEPIDSDEFGGGNASDTGVIGGDGKVVCLERPSETANSYLAQHAHLAGNLGLQYHSDTDTFSVKNGRGQNGLDGVTGGMTEVNEIAQTGFSFVDGDDMRFDRD